MSLTSASTALQRHTALAALSGYLYQVQIALLFLFRLQEGESLDIELLDDLDVEYADGAVGLTQVKYHDPSQRMTMTNSSRELWKTIGIWAVAVQEDTLKLADVRHLMLITCAKPEPGSIADMVVNRESADKVLAKMLTTPSSVNKEVLDAFEAFRSLTSEQQRSFVRRLVICAEEPGLTAKARELQSQLRRHSFHEQSLTQASERLSGWVWNKIVSEIEPKKAINISESDFHTVICHIRDELTQNALPARFLQSTLSNVDIAGQKERMYFRQLELIEASSRTIQRAIHAYFRAANERSTWIANGEVSPDKLQVFDQELVERWRFEFDNMSDDIQDWNDEKSLRRMGQEHLRTIERIHVTIDSIGLHHYLTYGSYHALADELFVGWHPRFQDLL